MKKQKLQINENLIKSLLEDNKKLKECVNDFKKEMNYLMLTQLKIESKINKINNDIVAFNERADFEFDKLNLILKEVGDLNNEISNLEYGKIYNMRENIKDIYRHLNILEEKELIKKGGEINE